MNRRIIVGMSGASGAPLAILLMKELKRCTPDIQIHLIMTEGAQKTLQYETDYSPEDVAALADVVYNNNNLAAAVASGSFRTDGMIIIPCSMKTLAGIVTGYSDNLLLRSADVTLKERRKLVLVPRESPLSTIHLRNMYELSQMGAVILPPVLSFYNHPATEEEYAGHIVGKVLDQFGIDSDRFRRWNGR